MNPESTVGDNKLETELGVGTNSYSPLTFNQINDLFELRVIFAFFVVVFHSHLNRSLSIRVNSFRACIFRLGQNENEIVEIKQVLLHILAIMNSSP